PHRTGARFRAPHAHRHAAAGGGHAAARRPGNLANRAAPRAALCARRIGLGRCVPILAQGLLAVHPRPGHIPARRLLRSAMTTMSHLPRRSVPAVLSLGFRPFFLLGALFAVIMVALWVPWFLGFIEVPTAFAPIAWHAHELLFGFVPAIVAGFLLTAVPNWTGRPPVAGWPLAGLVLVWLVGRIAIAVSTHLDPAATTALSVAFPVVLAAVVG